jgi:ATP-dependent DNA ligase
LRRERFVVVGFAPEGGGGLVKLRLARRDGSALIYVGRVGAGSGRKSAFEIRRVLTPLSRATCPLVRPIKRADTVWVQPRFEAEVVWRRSSVGCMGAGCEGAVEASFCVSIRLASERAP